MDNNELKVGWLSPSGELVECPYFDHYSTAKRLVNKLGYASQTNVANDDILMEHGWVHIGISLLGVKEWAIFWEGFLTESQKNFLKPYFEDEERPMNITALCRWEEENG